jgi:GT2 family glycosyltransferase
VTRQHDLAVVIVSYGSVDDVVELVATLRGLVEIVIVDNGGPPGSQPLPEFDGALVVRPGDNLGWSAGCNLGARHASASTIAFVNPDARPSHEALAALAGQLRPGVASVSPRFVEADGSTSDFYFRFPHPLQGALLFTPIGQQVDRAFGGAALRHRTYGKGSELPREVDHAGAACLVVTRAVFEASGGFDTTMWLFFSDAEWSLRTRRAGLRHVVAWDVAVRHVGGASVRQEPALRVQRLFSLDWAAYARAVNGPIAAALVQACVWLFAGALPATAALLRGRLSDARERLLILTGSRA